MPYREDEFAPDQYYHIFNRGAGREPIFFNPDNYNHCLNLMRKYAPKYEVTVIAYCLMPNHYHFLIRQETDQPLSKFINVLFNAYVQAINHQQMRTGTLFEGRFRHVRVDRDEYLVHLCRYIHNNPVKANLVKVPGDWQYSDYLDWIGQKPGMLIDKTFIKERFSKPEEYRQFVMDNLDETQTWAKMNKYVWD